MSLHAEAEAITHELFRTAEGRRDPYPRLARLRSIAPVHRSEVARAWLLTRHADVTAMLKDPRFEKRFAQMLDEVAPSWREHRSVRDFAEMMVQLDSPQHTRLRSKVARHFTARRINELRPTVERTVAELLDRAGADEADVFTELAYQLPITVIGHMLGIPTEELASFREPALAVTAGLDAFVGRAEREAADEAAEWLNAWFEREIGRRRREGGDDLFTALVLDDGDDPLDDRELVVMGQLLLIAGFETTTNVISAGLLALRRQPEQLALLRARPDELDHLADELLRLEASIQFANRVAVEDVEIGGHVIRAGEQVFAMLGAANRDPEVYEDPDRLDFTRPRPKHASFGGGIHHCLGAALARMELDVLLRQLSARFSSIELTAEAPRYRDTLAFRAVESLPVRLRSVADAAPTGCPVTGARPAASEDDDAWQRAERERREATAPQVDAGAIADRVALLERQPLFAACRASELVSLATTAYVLTFSEGDTIVRQDAVSDDVHLVLEGAAEVRIGDELIATLGPDDPIGERGVVTDSPRAATVTATEHTATLVFSRERFRGVMEGNPAAAATMIAVTEARYRQPADA